MVVEIEIIMNSNQAKNICLTSAVLNQTVDVHFQAYYCAV